MSIYESYEILKTKKVKTSVLLEWNFRSILKTVSRRITQRKKFKNPWTVLVSVDIHSSVYLEFYHAVKDYKIEFGRKVVVTRDKKNLIKEVKISFTHRGTLKFHLQQICNCEQILPFEKKWSNGNSAKIIVSEEKPAIFTFLKNKHKLTFSLHYKVLNKYGTVCI